MTNYKFKVGDLVIDLLPAADNELYTPKGPDIGTVISNNEEDSEYCTIYWYEYGDSIEGSNVNVELFNRDHF